jgi:hypothetical protein
MIAADWTDDPKALGHAVNLTPSLTLVFMKDGTLRVGALGADPAEAIAPSAGTIRALAAGLVLLARANPETAPSLLPFDLPTPWTPDGER